MNLAETLEATPPITPADLWPEEPLPLARETEPSAPYPVDALGPLAEVAQTLQAVIQAPMPLIANSLLAGASLAAQGHVGVTLDGRTYPATLHFLTIGESGERKSAVDAQVLAPHRKHERALQEQAQHERAAYRNAAELYERQRAEILKDKKADREAGLEALGLPPKAPFAGIFITAEPTYEGFVKLLDEGWPSVGLFSDEGGQFIGGFAMSKDNALKTASGLSVLWDGSAVDRVRAKEGATKLYGRRAAFHLMTQPDVARLLLGNSLLANQGFTNRVLVAHPESTAGNRPYNPADLSTHPVMGRYFATMMQRLELPLPFEFGADGEQGRGLEPRPVGLSAEAKDLWVGFHDHVERQLAQELDPVRGFAAKTPEQALRLAGVLAWIEDPSVATLEGEHLRAGIHLAQWYLTERLRVQQGAAVRPEIENAQKLLAWLQKGPPKVSTREIYQKGPYALRTAEAVRQALGTLQTHYWVRRVEGKGEFWEVRK